MVERWTTTLTDCEGIEWDFLYAGSRYVRVGPSGDPSWTNSIQLNDYGLKPDTVTEKWLTKRAAEWIDDRNKDIAAGKL